MQRRSVLYAVPRQTGGATGRAQHLVVFLRSRQGLIEIPQEVIEALQPNGNADHIWAEAGRDLLLISQLLVRGAARMNHQAFGVSHIGQMRMDLDGLDKTPSSGPTTFN